MVEYTNKIRELRLARGMTTEQLGKALGTTSATISRLESNKQSLTVEWIHRVAWALKVAPADIIDDAHGPQIAILRADLSGARPDRSTIDPPFLDPEYQITIRLAQIGDERLPGESFDAFTVAERQFLICEPVVARQTMFLLVQYVVLYGARGRPTFSIRESIDSAEGPGFLNTNSDPSQIFLKFNDPAIQRVWRVRAEYKLS